MLFLDGGKIKFKQLVNIALILYFLLVFHPNVVVLIDGMAPKGGLANVHYHY